MRFSLVSIASLLVLALPTAGCDDDVADSTFEPTSVPESKPIDDLDEEEQQDFCEEAATWAETILTDQLPTLLCNSAGISASAQQDGTFDLATCRAAREECLNDPETVEDFDDSDLECNFEGVETCGATVGEFSRCFEEAAKLLERSAAQLTCERIADGYVPNEADFTLSAECQALIDRCSGDAGEGGGAETPPE